MIKGAFKRHGAVTISTPVFELKVNVHTCLCVPCTSEVRLFFLASPGAGITGLNMYVFPVVPKIHF